MAARTHTARDNIFLNLRTGGTGSHFAAGSEVTDGSYTVGNNVYAGTGATAANFMDFSGTSGTPVPISFATWQSSTGDHHLVPGGNALVNGLGTPIAGVTTDFDGDPRSATTPTIGANEFTLPIAFSTWAAANGVANDPNAPGANGLKNLLNFAFGISPITGGPGALQYAGTFAGNGAITATGLPVTMLEIAGNVADLRALFVRRKNYAMESVSYTPQFSADLSTWQNSGAVPAVLADDGVNQIVSVPWPTFSGENSARFFRISVSLVP